MINGEFRKTQAIIASFGLTLCLNTASAAIYSGVLEVTVADYFDKNKQEISYFLHQGNTTYQLNIPNNLKIAGNLSTGKKVAVDGELNKKLKSNIQVIDVKSFNKISSKKLTNMLPGDHHALTLLVDFNDRKASNTTSISAIDNMMYLDAKSMQVVYEESSFNQAHFIRDTNNDSNADIYQVNLNYDVADTCDVYKWRDDAKAAAQSNGLDLSLYKHFVFVLPRDVYCSWGGLGNLGCSSNCSVWIKWNSTNVYAHELGHNLGMHHAATDTNNDGTIDSEYGDFSDFMGNSSIVRPLNAPHRYQMTYYNPYPGQVVQSPQPGTYILNPLEKSPSSSNSGHHMIVIPKPNSTDSYYFSYRKNIGTFGTSSTYADKVNVHYFSGGSNKTFYITSIAINESFVDVANNISVKVLAAGGDTATVEVQGNEPPPPPGPCLKDTPCVLQNAQEINVTSGLKNEHRYYYIDVPEGGNYTSLVVKLVGGSGNLNLYVRYAKIPNNGGYDCSSENPDNNEICALNLSKFGPGRWYIWLKAQSTYEGAKLVAQYN